MPLSWRRGGTAAGSVSAGLLWAPAGTAGRLWSACLPTTVALSTCVLPAGYEACVPRIVAVLDRLKQRDVTQVGTGYWGGGCILKQRDVTHIGSGAGSSKDGDCIPVHALRSAPLPCHIHSSTSNHHKLPFLPTPPHSVSPRTTPTTASPHPGCKSSACACCSTSPPPRSPACGAHWWTSSSASWAVRSLLHLVWCKLKLPSWPLCTCSRDDHGGHAAVHAFPSSLPALPHMPQGRSR